MSDVTKQSLSELVENIKSKKLSSSEVTILKHLLKGQKNQKN